MPGIELCRVVCPGTPRALPRTYWRPLPPGRFCIAGGISLALDYDGRKSVYEWFSVSRSQHHYLASSPRRAVASRGGGRRWNLSSNFKHGKAKHQTESQDHEREAYNNQHRSWKLSCKRSIAWSSPSASLAWPEMLGGGVGSSSSSFRTELLPCQDKTSPLYLGTQKDYQKVLRLTVFIVPHWAATIQSIRVLRDVALAVRPLSRVTTLASAIMLETTWTSPKHTQLMYIN